jgi:hypothetical protein
MKSTSLSSFTAFVYFACLLGISSRLMVRSGTFIYTLDASLFVTLPFGLLMKPREILDISIKRNGTPFCLMLSSSVS